MLSPTPSPHTEQTNLNKLKQETEAENTFTSSLTSACSPSKINKMVTFCQMNVILAVL